MDCPGTKTTGLTQKCHRKKRPNKQPKTEKVFWCATPLKIIKEREKKKKEIQKQNQLKAAHKIQKRTQPKMTKQNIVSSVISVCFYIYNKRKQNLPDINLNQRKRMPSCGNTCFSTNVKRKKYNIS